MSAGEPHRCDAKLARVDDREQAERELDAINAGAHDDAGVDITQIDIMLALSPAERLEMLYQTASSLSRLMTDAHSDTIL